MSNTSGEVVRNISSVVEKKLISKIGKNFKINGCEYSLVDVFAYNNIGIKFYDKNGYHSRMYTNIKRI